MGREQEMAQYIHRGPLSFYSENVEYPYAILSRKISDNQMCKVSMVFDKDVLHMMYIYIGNSFFTFKHFREKK